MAKSSALRKLLPIATFLSAALIVVSAVDGVGAQQRPRQGASARAPHYVQRGQPVGGYSALRLSDVWGPAEMPPPPKDFGPHFDFPPEPLNGAPLHDPYPK
jgi:hypothetical protein